MTGSLPQYALVVKTADGAVSDSPGRIMAILVDAEHADWELEFTNDGDGAGTNVIEMGGEAEGGQTYFDFTSIGGIYFSTKCYLDLTFTSGHISIWWDGRVTAA